MKSQKKSSRPQPRQLSPREFDARIRRNTPKATALLYEYHRIIGAKITRMDAVIDGAPDIYLVGDEHKKDFRRLVEQLASATFRDVEELERLHSLVEPVRIRKPRRPRDARELEHGGRHR